MFFAATYIFRMSREEFWKLTPRELAAYSHEYAQYQKMKAEAEDEDYNGTDASQPSAVYIDQIW